MTLPFVKMTRPRRRLHHRRPPWRGYPLMRRSARYLGNRRVRQRFQSMAVVHRLCGGRQRAFSSEPGRGQSTCTPAAERDASRVA